MKHNHKNEIGNRYGRLVVIEVCQERHYGKNLVWLCKCDCGKEHKAVGLYLRKGTTKSCGCLRNELSAKRMTKHGKVGTKVYDVWHAMMQRCYRETHEYYHRYGGRGIKVCDQWHDFQNFYNDMGDPKQGLSLERVDNNGNYSLENCKRATNKEQGKNKSTNRWIEFNGERLNSSTWSEKLGITQQCLYKRLKKFDIEKALTMPYGRWNKELNNASS